MNNVPQGCLNTEILVNEARKQDALWDGIAEKSERISTAIKYPRIFQSFFDEHLFSEFDIGPVTIFSNIRTEEHNIQELLDDKDLIPPLVNAGFFPFGRSSTGSYDPVCFDVRGREDSNDAPVVQIDHESILSKNRLPKPKVLAEGLGRLLES